MLPAPGRIIASLFFLALFCCQSMAQDADPPIESTESEASTIPGTQSGYEDILKFGGPAAVSSQLKRNDEEREFVYQFDGLQRGFAPYFD